MAHLNLITKPSLKTVIKPVAKVSISYDGHEAIINYGKSVWLEPRVTELLTYIDRSKEFIKKEKGLKHLKTDVCLYDRRAKTFPTGLLQMVHKLFISLGVEVEIVKLHAPVIATHREFSEGTRDYQISMALTAVKKRRGIIKAPTSAGKTRIAGEFLQFFPDQNCLWIVPSSKDLAYQTHKDLEKYLGEPVGFIGDSKFKPKRVTVGIINSLVTAVKKNPDFFRSLTVCVMDEVHLAGGKSYISVSEACRNLDYKVGLSATPERGDGSNLVMFGLTGPIIAEETEVAMVDSGNIVPPWYCQIHVKPLGITYSNAVISPGGSVKYDTPTGKPDTQEVYTAAVSQNSHRNKLVADAAELFLKTNYFLPGVIMVEHIAQGEAIKQLMLDKGYDIEFIHGNTKKDYKKQVLDEIQEGTRKLTIVSRILKFGISITSIGYIVLACGGSSDSGMIQRVGRAARKHPGKTTAIIVDFEDTEKWYVNNASRSRSGTINEKYQVGTVFISNVQDLAPYLT